MELEIKKLSDLTPGERSKLMHRSEAIVDELLMEAERIVETVRKDGDTAIIDFTARFDGVDITEKGLRVKEEELAAAEAALSRPLRKAISEAVQNVTRFHERQRPGPMHIDEISPGVFAGERATPIPSAGLYVPRGKGSFPSMLYMLAVPAQLADVPRVCIVTPPNKDGSVDPACLYAATLCDVREIYRIGGAQAIAALALGTETIGRVNKIAGPGSPYVAAAKRVLGGVVDTGLPAGPSESIVLADKSADPWKVSLDLLVEAEHGEDSAALLITDSADLAERVRKNVSKLVSELPEPRKSYVGTVLSGFGGILIAREINEMCDFVNEYAPEHLQIQTADPWDTLPSIINAGEILLGGNMPFSVANYAAGPNAVLPTGGKADTWSPVSVRDFIKYSSVIYATEKGLENISPAVSELAEYEGFPAHAQAVTRRKRGEAHGL